MANKAFHGSSEKEAIEKAKAELGDEILLIAAKQIQPKTATKEPIFEVIVAVDETAPKSKNKSANAVLKAYADLALKPSSQSSKQGFSVDEIRDDEDDAMINAISKAYSQISKSGGSSVSSENLSQSEIMNKVDNISKDLKRIQDQLGIISDIAWENSASSRANLAIPPEFASIYKASRASGMKIEHLDEIMRTTLENMPGRLRANPVTVRRYFHTLLRKMLPVRLPRQDNRQRIMMLVGPTGVGKTTTLAKLAARFAFSKERRYKTGIITLDTYRLGAITQLQTYAKIMKLPFFEVFEESDFSSALRSLNYCDIVLIDTMGSSQHDRAKLEKIDSFLRSSNAQIDVTLVLSASAKVEDLLEAYHNFSFLNIDTLIITKFDETRIFGNIFSLVYETGTPVSYFGIGQEVPDDLMQAKSEFLASCVLDGFAKEYGDGSSS